MENTFERMSKSCKYYEPGMPVYEEPGGQCLYYGRACIETCQRERCPLFADAIIVKCHECGAEFNAEEKAALAEIEMDELGKVTACPACGATNVDANTPPAPLQMKPKWIVKIDEYDPIDHGEDYEILVEFEFAVVREDNEHGVKSHGWPDEDKIILFDCDNIDIAVDDVKDTKVRDANLKTFEWMKKVTETVAKALNDNNL